jgi:hypothetical protein
MIRANLVAALAAAVAVLGFAASANAAPVSSAALQGGLSPTSGLAEQVDYRGYRHCHWRGGFRRCHGGYGNRYSGPGITLRFGNRHHGHRRHRR